MNYKQHQNPESVSKVAEKSSATPHLDRIVEHHEKGLPERIKHQVKKFRKVRRLKRISKFITLYEAIRRARVPQAIGALEKGDGSFCVLGAAAVGIGLSTKERGEPRELTVSEEDEISQRFSGLPHAIACPDEDCASGNLDLQGILIHLNDEHKWSLGRIASWVEKNYPEVKTKKKVEIKQYVIEEVEDKA